MRASWSACAAKLRASILLSPTLAGDDGEGEPEEEEEERLKAQDQPYEQDGGADVQVVEREDRLGHEEAHLPEEPREGDGVEPPREAPPQPIQSRQDAETGAQQEISFSRKGVSATVRLRGSKH